MPDIPTADETGVPGLYMSGWFGFWAPKGTPKDVIAKLNAATVEALADPADPEASSPSWPRRAPREQQTPEGLAAFQQAEIEKWWPIIKARRRSAPRRSGRRGRGLDRRAVIAEATRRSSVAPDNRIAKVA